MSEHHRGAWGTREDAVWWPSGISSSEQLAQQQAQLQHQVAEQQQQNDSSRNNSTTSTSTAQQLFLYKMANSYQNLVTTGITVSTSNTPAYDYRVGMSTVVARPGDPPTMSSTAPTTLCCYPGGQNAIDNFLQHQNQSHVQQNNAIQNKMVTNVTGGKVKHYKPRGRMTAYAFFVQTCREELKKKYPEEQFSFNEFSRKCGERWKTMLDKEKQRFHEMAEKDKQRYEREMQSYVPPKGAVVGHRKKRKQFKDPNAPKRSLSAFFWFCHDERNKVKALNPEYGVGDIAKELGRKWWAMDAEIKQKYEQMAEKDKQRYKREMTEYNLKCNNEQGTGAPGLNLPQQLQQAGLQDIPPHVQQAAAASGGAGASTAA